MNRFFHHIISIVLFFFCWSFFAQGQDLSSIGSRHWRTANTLWDMATSLEQKEMAILEYEKVKESDPQFPDTYNRLGSIYFELAKEYQKDVYFERAKHNYIEYKAICPQDSNQIDDELYLIESVQRMSRKSSLQDNKQAFVGVWVNKDSPFSLIFRIKEEGNDYAVSVSTPEEQALETKDVIFDGETLSFTVRYVDRMSSPHTLSWREDNRSVEVICDLEEGVDFWKLSYDNGHISATNEWHITYSLNGQHQRTRYGRQSCVLSRR